MIRIEFEFVRVSEHFYGILVLFIYFQRFITGVTNYICQRARILADSQLKDNFSARFNDFFISRDVIGFVRDPFTISPRGEFSTNVVKMMPLNEAAIQSELAEIQAAGDMKAALRGAESLSAFWVPCPKDYGTLKMLAMYVLTMFSSTYTCEAAFSKMNLIKTHERNRLFAHESDSGQA